jgi:hypothetical protein
MSDRICDKCGNKKDLSGGRACPRGHFVCKSCVWETAGLLFGGPRTVCPLCKKTLR